MRDIDFLVEEADLPGVEAVLGKLGYHQQSSRPAGSYATHHHSMPFYHPQRGVWVEVHRGLVPQREKGRAGRIFRLDTVKSQLRPSVFRGRVVTRLSDELQIPYIASHWAREFKTVGGMVALLDIMYLLKNTGGALDWGRILDWMRDSTAAAHLYLLLAYLDFRAALVRGGLPDLTCLLGTLVQETFTSHPALRAACGAGIEAHASTLVPTIEAARRRYAPDADWTAESLARHTQVVLQGAFVLAKALDDPAVVLDAVAQLRRHVELLLPRPTERRRG